MKDVDFWLDEYVSRYRLSPRYFKDIFRFINDNINEGEKEGDDWINLRSTVTGFCNKLRAINGERYCRL